MFPPDVISSHFDAGNPGCLSRDFLVARARSGAEDLPPSSSSSNRIDFRSRERYHPSTRREFDEDWPSLHTRVYTCANVYRFKKRSHHPLFLFHPDRGIDIPDHPDLFLDVGPPLWNRVYRLPFRFRSRLTDDTPQKIENGIWFRGEMRLHGMAKMFSKEMDQDAILDRSLSTWRWEIEISVVSYCSIILFYPPTFTFSFARRWMKKGVWWKSREN